jgi:hypothetical protein
MVYRSAGALPVVQSGQGNGSSALISAELTNSALPVVQSGQGNGSSALISAKLTSSVLPVVQSGQGNGSSALCTAATARNCAAKIDVNNTRLNIFWVALSG